MNKQLRLEGLGLFALSVFAYHFFAFDWTLFFILFFTPDISFLGYLISPKAGGIFYNLLHHQGFIAVILIIGIILNHDFLISASLIYFSHSNFDRMLGYGLKQMDSFHNTHLGKIGNSNKI